jgi:hypothetical protein
VGEGVPPKANTPSLVYVSPAGKVKTFHIPSNPQAMNTVGITVDGSGNILGESMERVLKDNTIDSYSSVTWLLDPRSGRITDLPGTLCVFQGCTLGTDGYFWAYPLNTPSHAHPNGYYPGVIIRIDPDTNQIVYRTPVPQWIQSHVSITDIGTNLGYFGEGDDGTTWFSVYDAPHFWLASFNVYTKAFHHFQLPGTFPVTGGSGSQFPGETTQEQAQQDIGLWVVPDGSLWAAAAGSDGRTTIYHYTPDGQLATFSAPSNWQELIPITVEKLWFGEK